MPSLVIPALLTRTSMGPIFSSTFFIPATHSSYDATKAIDGDTSTENYSKTEPGNASDEAFWMAEFIGGCKSVTDVTLTA